MAKRWGAARMASFPSVFRANMRSMSHPAYIREKARQMRIERDLTIDEIAERLAISRQTIFHWVKDVPLRHARRTPALERRDNGNRARYKALRDEAYEEGHAQYDELIEDPMFRDFICLYIAEGYKRCRNRVSLGNSDPNVIVIAHYWIRRFGANPVFYSLQYHADQDPDELCGFWGRLLGIEPKRIRLQRKSNSGQLANRTWRSRWGVLTVGSDDTYFRARLQAWIDCIGEEWLDLTRCGA